MEIAILSIHPTTVICDLPFHTLLQMIHHNNYSLQQSLQQLLHRSAISLFICDSYQLQFYYLTVEDEKDYLFRFIALAVLIIGMTLSSLGIKPIQLILVAQMANGLLLPLVAMFLIYAANSRKLLGNFTNGWMQNLFAVLVVLLTMALAGKVLFNILI